MGQVESSYALVANNPFVAYGRTPEEAIGNLALCLRYYGYRGVRRRRDTLPSIFYVIVGADGERRRVWIEKSPNTDVYRARVDTT